MTSTIFVRKLNKSGRYVSDLDVDKAFVDWDNTEGFFKVVVEPIENEIVYQKVKDGYLVKGEGYLIVEPSEKLIDEQIRGHHNRRFTNVVMTEVDYLRQEPAEVMPFECWC